MAFDRPNSSERVASEESGPLHVPLEDYAICDNAFVRTTLDIPDEPSFIAKAIARDQNRSLGRVVGELILQASHAGAGGTIQMSDYGFPTFRCKRPVTSEEVKALEDEE